MNRRKTHILQFFVQIFYINNKSGALLYTHSVGQETYHSNISLVLRIYKLYFFSLCQRKKCEFVYKALKYFKLALTNTLLVTLTIQCYLSFLYKYLCEKNIFLLVQFAPFRSNKCAIRSEYIGSANRIYLSISHERLQNCLF